jgi:hypothetical protein
VSRAVQLVLQGWREDSPHVLGIGKIRARGGSHRTDEGGSRLGAAFLTHNRGNAFTSRRVARVAKQTA